MPTAASPATNTPANPGVHRVEVYVRDGRADARGEAALRDARSIGLAPRRVRSAKVYLIEAPLSLAQLERIRDGLLVNPVVERGVIGAESAPDAAPIVEVHPLPGVMDPAAQTVREAIAALTGVAASVSTGERFDFVGLTRAEADSAAGALLANPVIQRVHDAPFHPPALPRGEPYRFRLTHAPIRDLDDAGLERLSREGHLFLDLHEMQAIRDYYRAQRREPTDIELETLAQTWSEHCVHKTLKSTITYRPAPGSADGAIRIPGLDAHERGPTRPGHTRNPDGSVTIHNLLKSTVAAATFELIAEGVDWALSVFKDNAGVIAFDDQWAINIKVETHNHPSAIEPYGGAATGVGGCIRDVIGTGLGAKPIANTDVFCVAFPDAWAEPGAKEPGSGAPKEPRSEVRGLHQPRAPLPAGVIHPRRVLSRVVAGVRDYGNRMGIPTVSGAVAFDNRYIGNPLVFCGCVGLMPRDKIFGKAREGDLIVAVGGRTGRDGIHGATFSSAELTDTHADEFSHAVQIGNAIEEKRALDAILRARDAEGGPLYTAMTDCGAGGFSSAVGEMASELGATVRLDRAPLKYEGLSYAEVWISEAQERMVLAVPPGNLEALTRICEEEAVEIAVLGEFGTPTRDIVLRYRDSATGADHEVGRLSVEFLHEGIPTPTREAAWMPPPTNSSPRSGEDVARRQERGRSTTDCLLALLAHPTVASKRWIIRQYDHEVQGISVAKPLVGAAGDGPGDASVLAPVAGSSRAIAIAQGLATGVGHPDTPGGDPYLMALAAVDECVRNLVCVGADPDRIAILDNFCWPSCRKPHNLAGLVRAAEGCYDAAKTYRTPFVSGKDSLNNQFTTEDGRTIEIPPTLLITGVGMIHDASRCVTSDAKRAGNTLVLVGPTHGAMGASIAQSIWGMASAVPRTDLALGPATARAVAGAIAAGLIASAHDVSDGGLLCAVAEMLFGSRTASGASLGAELNLRSLAWAPDSPEADCTPFAACFGESPSRYVLEVAPDRIGALHEAIKHIPHAIIGSVTNTGRLALASEGLDAPVETLFRAWTGTLDW